jgi:hypothetical protein
MIDVSDTIIAKSDQLNSDDLISGPITIKITGVNKPGGDQPISIKYEGDNGRPFKPCKTVRRILVKAWGKDASQWTGRLMTLYNEPTVKWAGKEVGGIRVSHLSHIDRDIQISLTETRGSKKPHNIKKLQSNAATQPAPAPANASPPPAADEDLGPDAPNIRLIKSDGSEIRFDNFQTWIDMIGNNLPKIDTIDRLKNFQKNHDPIFSELESSGWGEWVGKARAIVQENLDRLEPPNGEL